MGVVEPWSRAGWPKTQHLQLSFEVRAGGSLVRLYSQPVESDDVDSVKTEVNWVEL